jgi:protein TonB
MKLINFLPPAVRAVLLAAAIATVAGCATTAPAIDTSGDKQGALLFNSCARPVYPVAARQEKREGTVAFDFLVDAQGTMTGSRIAKSSGSADLDEAAHSAIKLCKFSPAIEQGKPVPATVKVQYVWTLK